MICKQLTIAALGAALAMGTMFAGVTDDKVRPERPQKPERTGFMRAGVADDKVRPERPQKPEKTGVMTARHGQPEDNPKGEVQRPERPQKPEKTGFAA